MPVPKPSPVVVVVPKLSPVDVAAVETPKAVEVTVAGAKLMPEVAGVVVPKLSPAEVVPKLRPVVVCVVLLTVPKLIPVEAAVDAGVPKLSPVSFVPKLVEV